MNDSSQTSRSAPFQSIYRHAYVRVAGAVPNVRIGDPAENARRTVALARRAAERHAALVVFPELGLTSYTSEDLFRQDALLDATLTAIEQIRLASAQLSGDPTAGDPTAGDPSATAADDPTAGDPTAGDPSATTADDPIAGDPTTATSPVIVVGAPLRAEQGLFNAAIVIHNGRILGAVPKSYLPEYREFYEKRHFRAARDLVGGEVTISGQTVPFGNDLIFAAADIPNLAIHVEICEDLWSPIPHSTFAALGGATVLANLSASNIVVGKADYRRMLCAGHSARTLSAHVYTAAGSGESTTDLAWDGHALIYENGELLAESERFAPDEHLIFADVDLDRLTADRSETSTWGDSIHDHRRRLARLRTVSFELNPPAAPVPLERAIERFPYVPADARSRHERCEEVYRIQVAGLETRLQSTGIEKLVIGVSGGLDSTHALIVAARALDRLGLPRQNVLAYTMPGFGTSDRTLQSARELMRSLGVTANELDIRPAAQLMLESIGHPAADGSPLYDTTYENVQAGERTSHLFRLANMHNALVLGTGDLSELALGWCTYGVGDQMSHYNVNASVPKTLIQFLLRWVIGTEQFGADVSQVLADVLDTEISPELIPVSASTQSSEQTVGPYELQDFFLYHVLRFGNRPSKVAWLAQSAWGDRSTGSWPDLIPPTRRNQYDLPQIEHWLREFLHRFFQTSQFKRSAIPNGPKVGSGGSLSPRGDWRAPSDGNATTWLAELEEGLR